MCYSRLNYIGTLDLIIYSSMSVIVCYLGCSSFTTMIMGDYVKIDFDGFIKRHCYFIPLKSNLYPTLVNKLHNF